MSENKCPFCGDAMITTEDKIMLCENSDCATMFNEWDYPKVAAAMDLAIATAAYFTLATEAGYSRLQSAGDRVLEVFNG